MPSSPMPLHTRSSRVSDEHCPGTRLNASVTLVSNTVAAKDNLRTIVVTRPFVGAGPDYYSFDPASQATLPQNSDVYPAGQG